MKRTFDCLITEMDIDRGTKKIIECKDISIKATQTKKQREQLGKIT